MVVLGTKYYTVIYVKYHAGAVYLAVNVYQGKDKTG